MRSTPEHSSAPIPSLHVKAELDLLPVRMINEVVYCPRLYYLEHVMGEWAPSADTAEGKALHAAVDRRSDSLAAPDESDQDDPRHRARSITLSSAPLGIIAKMDIVEVQGASAVPVDVKHGHPPNVPERAYLPERVQVCAQGLILRDNGFCCEGGIIYYPETKQRVAVPFDDELVRATLDAISAARRLEGSAELPEPLADSPKCPRCSLVGICLPDEVNLLRAESQEPPGDLTVHPVRKLVPASDDALPLHVADPGARVGITGHRLVVTARDGRETIVALKDTSHVSIFGGVQISTQAVARLMSESIPIGYFSSGGWFYGLCAPIGHSAVAVRRRQYARSGDIAWCLAFARGLVRSKIRNARTLLRRNHRGDPAAALGQLRQLAQDAGEAPSAEVLLGIEGLAAREYFGELRGMIRTGDEGFGFDFAGRNRRPPRDPVNAMLSFAYSLLVRHLTAACAIVGLDPHLGFYHADRPGRPSLALDLMEPFRPLVGDSAVITAINNGEVGTSDFVHAAGSCCLTDSGRKRFIACFERRLGEVVTHPLFGYRISYRRLLEVQARLLSRHILGELPHCPCFETR
jgi:CRISPR-associated protein Cas1